MNYLYFWMRIFSRRTPLPVARPSFCPRVCAAAVAFATMLPHDSHAVMLGQLDDFQDGTVLAWLEGVLSPNPPVNIATGGPLGPGDRFLQNISTGDFGAGSRLVMFNSAQWDGNFIAAGVTQIVGQMANFGNSDLFMRITLSGGSEPPDPPTRFSSTNRIVLPPDGVWRTVTFDLSTSALTRVAGLGTLANVLSDVTELRVLSAQPAPSFLGDVVAATLGMDNLRAVPEPSAAAALIVGLLGLTLRRDQRPTTTEGASPTPTI